MNTILSNEFVVLSVVFAAIVLIGIALSMMLQRDAGAERIKVVAQTTKPDTQFTDNEVSLVYEDHLPKALRLIEPLQRRLAQSDPKQVSAARGRLIEAGFYDRNSVETYFAMRIVLGFAFSFIAIAYLLIFPLAMSANIKLFLIVASAALGYYLPSLYIAARIDNRRKQFKLGMPDALDMMLVGVEAGLSLSASMTHIVKEFSQTHPIIAEQFQIVTLEFQAGRSRAEALTSLAKRMNLPITRTLASMIIQSEQLGTSMAQTLQVMAQELRSQRMLDAEKKAAELPVKMSIPLVLCIFPALMAVALVPAIISTINFFGDLPSS